MSYRPRNFRANRSRFWGYNISLLTHSGYTPLQQKREQLFFVATLFFGGTYIVFCEYRSFYIVISHICWHSYSFHYRERCVRIAEVKGSNPSRSILCTKRSTFGAFLFYIVILFRNFMEYYFVILTALFVHLKASCQNPIRTIAQYALLLAHFAPKLGLHPPKKSDLGR